MFAIAENYILYNISAVICSEQIYKYEVLYPGFDGQI